MAHHQRISYAETDESSPPSPSPEREATPYVDEGMKPSVEDTAEASTRPSVAHKADAHKFKGFLHIERDKKEAISFANKIYQWPVPEQVTQRIIVWTGTSLHARSFGAAAILWMQASDDTKEPLAPKTKKLRYPHNTSSPDAVALFGIATALRFALAEIDTPSTNILHLIKQDDQLYSEIKKWYDKELTRSHTHLKTKEVFVFTESRDTLVWLPSAKGQPTEELRVQIEQIRTLSEQIERSGIHLEIHWCPPCRRSILPEKALASDTARKLAMDVSKAHPPA